MAFISHANLNTSTVHASAGVDRSRRNGIKPVGIVIATAERDLLALYAPFDSLRQP